MALITSYATLQDAIGTFLARSDLSTVDVELIDLAEKRIQREVRTPDMETSYSGTTSSGTISVPTDFLEWKVVNATVSNSAQRLQPKSIEWIFQNYPNRTASGGGSPKFIGRSGSTFVFGPFPDTDYAITGLYYKRLTSVASSWNALATANPDLYLYASLSAASAYIQDDPRLPVWEQAYRETRDAVNREAQLQELSGAPLRVTRG